MITNIFKQQGNYRKNYANNVHIWNIRTLFEYEIHKSSETNFILRTIEYSAEYSMNRTFAFICFDHQFRSIYSRMFSFSFNNNAVKYIYCTKFKAKREELNCNWLVFQQRYEFISKITYFESLLENGKS